MRRRIRITHMFCGLSNAFVLARLRSAREAQVDPSLTSRPDLLRIFRRDGIVIAKGAVERAVVSEIVADIDGRTDLLSARPSPGISTRYGAWTLDDPVRHVPSSALFFDSDLVAGLARAYLSRDAVQVRPTAQLRVNTGEQDPIVSLFHIDAWRPLVCVFLLLTDVGIDQAPMQYLKRSHRSSLWRLPKEAEWFEHEERLARGAPPDQDLRYRGCWLPPESRLLRERYGLECLTCTAPAGSVILFDKRGLHRATTLVEKRRLTLSADWALRSHPFVARRAAASGNGPG